MRNLNRSVASIAIADYSLAVNYSSTHSISQQRLGSHCLQQLLYCGINESLSNNGGHAITQVVSHWLPMVVARIRAWVRSHRICPDKTALGQVFSEYFGFPCQPFLQLPHTLHHSSSSEGSTTGHLVASVTANSVSFHEQIIPTDCRQNLVSTFVDKGVSCGQRGGSPMVVNLSFLDRSNYFSFK
jgi:hypothetical protein